VDTYEYETDCLTISPGFKKLVTLQVAQLLVRNFCDGEKPLTYSQISNRLAMPLRLVHNIIFDLVEGGLVSEIKIKADKEFAYQPARDISLLSIKYVMDALERTGTDTVPVAKTDQFRALSDALENLGDAVKRSPANKLLKDI
jgi:membrane protein